MRTQAEVQADIAAVQSALEDVHGSQTEVYARIVGYYRSVRNWNKGKREEFGERKMFADKNEKTAVYAGSQKSEAYAAVQYPALLEVYTRRTCPNCPPVKAYCNELDIPVRYIDADTEEGLKAAAAQVVRSCPAVIMYNTEEKEIARAYSVADLKAYGLQPCTAKVNIA